MSPHKGREGDSENDKGEGGEEGEAYCPDTEKGWKSGQPGKDNGQGGVGQ